MTTASLEVRCTARIGTLRLDVELDTCGGTLVVVGPNGAGKSSLLDVVLGLRSVEHGVERGRVAVGGDVLFDSEAGIDVPLEARRLGYVPQDYALFPHLSVRGNIAFAIASEPRKPERALLDERVDALLRDLGLESLADRRPETLSGGEKQRVALARALSVRPRALLFDEPLAALDVRSRAEVRSFLAHYLERAGLPALVVTHDAADARALAQRIAVLESGSIVQAGSFAELAQRPKSRFVEELVASAVPG